MELNTLLLIILISIDVILIGIVVFLCIKNKKVYRAYDTFMRGRDAESLEELIIQIAEKVNDLDDEDHANKEAIRLLNKLQRGSLQKVGIVHYNALKGMGGNLSFACALLDYTNTGFVLNSVLSNEGCYVYVKTVDCGKTEVLLGTEEQEALEKALGYIE